MSKDAMKLALEALESLKVTVSNRTEANVIDGVDLFPTQIAALRKALANEALDKKAENARELGLDYEPAQQEPFGYFKAEPFGWTDCAESDEGAVALYERPQPAQKPQRWAVFCQGCRKEWSVSYPHPGKSICVDCDDKLAQQEPVAWEQFYPDMGKPELAYLPPTESPENACYAPSQRTWVGLSHEEIDYQAKKDDHAVYFALGALWAEAKLKEKNNG
jgi:hypothetical protein